MPSVLILEDNIYIRANLKDILEINEYTVEEAKTVREFWEKQQRGRYNIYLIDILLPDGNGFDVCSDLRKICKEPVLFLTSCDDEESITKGLDIGADDYITKPFRAAELLSRIKANLRRMDMNNMGTQDNNDMLNDLSVDLQNYILVKQGKEIKLSPTEWELLNILISRSGLIVKREILLAKLWDNRGDFVEDNTLTVAVSRLKTKLGKNTRTGREYIETLRGIGYRWIQ